MVVVLLRAEPSAKAAGTRDRSVSASTMAFSDAAVSMRELRICCSACGQA